MKNLVSIILLVSFTGFSQTQIAGIISDADTKLPLPFASVISNTNAGTLTDVDGKFHLSTLKTVDEITISYVGYNSVNIPIAPNDKFLNIKLKGSIEHLDEILINAKENPALQIIRNTIENKSKNNIEKSLNSFRFNSYNKILVTANPDSLSGAIDSIFVIKDGVKQFKKLDSSNYEFKKELEKQHLFISEKISEFKFSKGRKKKEVVLASRMAGLKQPLYELLAVTIQDFSFYNEFYVVAGTKYTNPIAKNALKHYNYKILDTVSNSNGRSILIYYKPKEKKAYAGIEGVLYIDAKSYAITKAIAEIKGGINIKATQNFNYVEDYKTWFPQEMSIVLKKGSNNENMFLFGGAINFNENKKKDSILSTQKSDPSEASYFISRSVNSNIEINTDVKVRGSSSTIIFTDDSHKKNEDFWKQYRTDSITQRGKRTYMFIDSIAESEGVDNKINLARNVLNGYFPTKYFNFNLGKIFNLNSHEGIRLGLGGTTNTNFSNNIRLESYVAFGTKDEEFKYSFEGSTRLNKATNTWLGLNYTNDIREAASLNFIAGNASFSPFNPRNLNISKFYNYKTTSGFIKHDIQPNLESKLEFKGGRYEPLFDYEFLSVEKSYSSYYLSTATIGFQYNPFSEYMNTPVGKITTKNYYPQFSILITKSFEDFLKGDFNFTKLNFRTLYKLKRLRKSTTTFLFEGGIIYGETPISHLYNATPNYTFKSPWNKRVTFAGKNSFETMAYNEFISDKFVALHVKHELKTFKISSKFKPQLTLVSRGTFGAIKNPESHSLIEFKNLRRGYFESGLELNRLFKGFGISSYYRFGHYQNPLWSDNLAVKLTYKFSLNF
jgi:hypothetical protein